MKKQIGTVAALAAAFVMGAMAVSFLPRAYGQPAQSKKASMMYGFTAAVRKPNEPDVTKDTKKFVIEVYKDENSGNLVYVSETGSIAVVPGK